MEAVRIVHEPKRIKLLIDPIRREILRSLTIKTLTGTQLARLLRIAKSTVAHHLNLLKKAKMIRIKKSKIGKYGILEKYYEPTALLFIEDYNRIGEKLRKRFEMIHMERLIGLMMALELFRNTQLSDLDITRYTKNMDELVLEFMKQLINTGSKYKNINVDIDAEVFCTRIYGEALKKAMKKSSWNKVLTGINGSRGEMTKKDILIEDELMIA